jgi:hypothetical protein
MAGKITKKKKSGCENTRSENETAEKKTRNAGKERQRE